MAELGTVVQSVGTGGMDIMWVGVWIGVVLIFLAVIAFLVYLRFFKIKWNLRVEIKLPRSDGRIINGEWGKGFYDSRKGTVFIKRPGRLSEKIPIKIFDVKRYLQGEDLLTVIQLSAEDYRPVLNNSYTEHDVEYEDHTDPKLDDEDNPLVDEDGNPIYNMKIMKESIMNIKTETGKNKAWRIAFEDAAMNAFTIKSLFRQFQAPISIGIVVICCFIGFAVLWTKLSSVCM
jgi:hypothetical protein